jgi:hypothetical protein
LDGFATDGVDCKDGEPVAGYGPSAHEDKTAECVVDQRAVDGVTMRVPDCVEDDTVVEAEAAKGMLVEYIGFDRTTV